MSTLIRELPPIEAPLEDEPPEDDFDYEESVNEDFENEDGVDIEALIEKIVLFSESFCRITMFPYQREVALRIARSVVTDDNSEITVIQARQSGKSFTLGTVLTGLMILLPRLAKEGSPYAKLLEKFKDGFWVGIFAPTDEQALTVWQRIADNFMSKKGREMMLDPEINEKAEKTGSKTRLLTLNNSGSYCRMQSANKRSNIESKSYHFVLIDEAQDVDGEMIRRSIAPMTAFYNGPRVLTGTGRPFKCEFLDAIKRNKRLLANRGIRNHFEYTYKTICKYNKAYKKYIAGEIAKYGEDSPEFLMSYCCKFILEQGMFVTEEAFGLCGDPRMEIVPYWGRTPVVVGIDPARRVDSTVVTVMWVDWDREPDPYGYREHRILNWLELHNKPWEQQYVEIVEFLSNYNILRIGVDAQGMGDAVAERISVLLPSIHVEALSSDPVNQAQRWKHMKALIERDMFRYPAGRRTRRLKAFRKFNQQFTDLETKFVGKHMLAEAPVGRGSHDDYCDSAAIAAWMTKVEVVEEAEFAVNPMVAWRRG